METFGKLDVKFNNAGVNKPMHFLEVTEENWDFIMRINGLGVLIGMQEAAKQMIEQGTGGKIINTASIASRQGFDNVVPYCASKFAVVSLTQSAARDLAKHDITVTGFAPGVVHTEMWDTLDQDLMELGASERPGQAMDEFSAEILKGRVATPADITGTTTFLASPGERLHDRTDRDDRRRHDAGMTRVGFAGLGRMGALMASNLAGAGFQLALWNRSREKAEQLAGATNAVVSTTPRELAERSDVVITMLADDDASHQVHHGR